MHGVDGVVHVIGSGLEGVLYLTDAAVENVLREKINMNQYVRTHREFIASFIAPLSGSYLGHENNLRINLG